MVRLESNGDQATPTRGDTLLVSVRNRHVIQATGLAARIFPGQQAAAQRRIGHRCDPLITTHRQDFDLDLTLHQIVHRLQHRDLHAKARCNPLRFHDLPGGKV
jgi:redox-regulated HSP33 family molecular chaperone